MIFAQATAKKKVTLSTSREKYQGYLFAYFTGNRKSEEAIRFAISIDGYHYRALNNNEPIVSSEKISSTGGVRDPHILRGADGKTFYMVATDMVSAHGWNSNRAMVLLKSTDLVNWTSSVVNIQKRFPGNDSLLRVWAPQTIYYAEKKKYMVYFSLKHGNQPDKIYYAYANNDFTDLETAPVQLFYSPDNAACIDGDIEIKDGKYYLFFKTEDRLPGIKVAVSNKLTEGYVMQSDNYVQQTKSPVEGAGTFKLNDGSGYVLMYDMYTSGKYQFTKTTDFKSFSVIDQDIAMNFHPRHGTVMPVTTEEIKRLSKEWMSYDAVITNVANAQIKKINIVLDTATKTLTLPVLPGTDLKNFDPGFVTFPGITVTAATRDFSSGGVRCTVAIAGKGSQSYTVKAVENHNPAIAGLYADPDIIFAEKTGRFYMFPTSDGFNGWSGTYFKSFSSPDLVNWKDEGVILQLGKDVSWAKSRAWAPCIIERKVNGQYKYYYYFCAEAKIGVAVSDNPTGPFVDLGQPLISKRPEVITRGGQTIDPDVFQDPQTGKCYLYWGNGYMAGAELNDDMISLKTETIKDFTPDSTYREGTHVFYRNGIYYFMWSEDDTRDPNYRVRYGMSTSPMGPMKIPVSNLVVARKDASGIYGTGHNSTIQVPGKDEWYLVYHRFNYPNGIKMGGDAGFNREVCIDKMEFNPDGTIKQVVPTHEGIKPVK
ncbi:family 43 glycosylhydrolase [Parasegetibacter sp. MAH-26]|uniref:Family 43 glycosylhydrolase n=2 Tax=Pinibacter aurantiacus TaxID=2851599 RepID=A0A9E2W4J5_9BACT|nr:family 43 glycosylhydrolase [Pinibacter aurantiacus]